MSEIINFWCIRGQHRFESTPDKKGKMKNGKWTFIKRCPEHKNNCYRIIRNDRI